METIQIHTLSKDYPVYIGTGVIEKMDAFLNRHFTSLTKILIITDENVGRHYLENVQRALSKYQVCSKIVPNGEKAKTFEVYYECLTFALEQKLDRKSVILALGGGAVGDLSGFVAATYMRGIPFVQIPTTILAHDSAVGGKVAINHPLGKNMIGAFYQPSAVFYDLGFLTSLPQRERLSGFAEVIKHALIKDPGLYQWLKGNISSLDSLTEDQLTYFLVKGIQIKGSIVSEDEKEAGVRAFLNFGHTLGHAIEAELGYGTITHGEAVMIGILFALQLSKKVLNLDFDTEEFKKWLDGLGYELDMPVSLKHAGLLERMKQDKKTIGQNIQFVLLERIGSPRLCRMDDEMVLNQLHLMGRND